MTKYLAIALTSLLFAQTAGAMGAKPPPGTQRPPTATPAPTPKATPVPPVGTPKPPSTPTPKPPASTEFKALWEGKHADASNWTRYSQDAIERYGATMMKGTSDMDDFCPKYDRLGRQDQTNFWVQLIAAMTKFESGFDPTERYTESTMGTDPVTGKQVVSEGLLQLSYQDERNYGKVLPAGVCDFDYERDRTLPQGDGRRTILDAKTNLTCGIAILNRQIERYGKISISTGAYWSVLKPTGRRIPEIRQITNALPFCN